MGLSGIIGEERGGSGEGVGCVIGEEGIRFSVGESGLGLVCCGISGLWVVDGLWACGEACVVWRAGLGAM